VSRVNTYIFSGKLAISYCPIKKKFIGIFTPGGEAFLDKTLFYFSGYSVPLSLCERLIGEEALFIQPGYFLVINWEIF